jgi:hypothetical protein
MITVGVLGLTLCTIRRKDNQKKLLQMFPDDDIRETIINYADGAGEENTVKLKKTNCGFVCSIINNNIKKCIYRQ